MQETSNAPRSAARLQHNGKWRPAPPSPSSIAVTARPGSLSAAMASAAPHTPPHASTPQLRSLPSGVEPDSAKPATSKRAVGPEDMASQFSALPDAERVRQLLERVRRNGGNSIIDFICEHAQTLPAMRSHAGRPVLTELVLAGQHLAMRYLLKLKNADQHLLAQCRRGTIALMHAAQTGSLISVATLLSASPEMAVKQLSHQLEGDNALMVAACHGHADVLAYLLQDSNLAAMQLACRSESGDNALIYAAANGHYDAVFQLMSAVHVLAEKASDLTPIYNLTRARNAQGLRAIDLAASYGERAIVQLLKPWTVEPAPGTSGQSGATRDQLRRPW